MGRGGDQETDREIRQTGLGRCLDGRRQTHETPGRVSNQSNMAWKFHAIFICASRAR
jgi:hypothetical protein